MTHCTRTPPSQGLCDPGGGRARGGGGQLDRRLHQRQHGGGRARPGEPFPTGAGRESACATPALPCRHVASIAPVAVGRERASSLTLVMHHREEARGTPPPVQVLGLALLNSAGPISAEGFSIEAWERDAAERQPPPRWLAAGISQALIWYLERTVPGTLQWLYPTRPERTRGWLTDEIERAGEPARPPRASPPRSLARWRRAWPRCAAHAEPGLARPNACVRVTNACVCMCVCVCVRTQPPTWARSTCLPASSTSRRPGRWRGSSRSASRSPCWSCRCAPRGPALPPFLSFAELRRPPPC